jgi:CRP/FNR family transcriptional regulator, cyclic AMP receptor protein
MSPLFRRRRVAKTGRTEGEDAVRVKLGLLHESELFHDFNEQQMRRLEEITRMTTCRRGRVIYTPGETGEGLFLLKKGLVHLYRLTGEGKKLLVGVLGPGTLFGDMAYTANSMSNNFAEAAEDSTLCVMSRHDVEQLVAENPAFAVRLIALLAGRLREVESRFEESALRDMQSRVCAALLREEERQGKSSIATTHQELADAIGTYRETVTRTLGDLQSRGAIQLDRGTVRIVDQRQLKELLTLPNARTD